uniref:Protein transport protein SEC23 n=1 Tax=Hemiselmis tepida TaxID=464990 RepID=A0A7S0WBM9_9CRYP
MANKSIAAPHRGAAVFGTMLRPSLKRTPEAAAVKDSAGLPWGCCVTPLAPAMDTHPNLQTIGADEVPRCCECFAYINAYCMFERKAWLCSLCGTRNELGQRYATSMQRAGLEEMQRGIVDVLEDCIEVDDVFSSDLRPQERPAVIAVVDVSGSEESVEMARTGLLAMLAALPDACLFGMVSVDSSVSVWDMRGDFPHCYSVGISGDGEVQVPLEEVLPVDCMLVQVSENRRGIENAIEMLAPTPPSFTRGAARGGLAFGPAVDGLLEAFEAEPFCSLRLVAILGHLPSVGVGSLQPIDGAAAARDGKKQGSKKGFDGIEASGDYAELADRVVALSACVDLFVVSEEGYAGIDALLPLVEKSGGTLVHYPSVAACTLPTDLNKCFSRPFATGALLRVRCSSGFRVARAYGHLSPDDQYENLYHVACCHSDSSFAVDFEFDNPSGVVANLDVHPTVQCAFSYTCVVPVGEGDAGSYQVQRRLRIETVRTDIGRQALELYSSVDAEVVMSLLCHKIGEAIRKEGMAEARMLLQDWLVILTARYNQHVMRRTGAGMDTSFAKYPPLQMLPRFVHGMLRGRMMDAQRASRDERAFVRHLCCSLRPEFVCLMLYPRLSFFEDLDATLPGDTPLVLSHSAIDQDTPHLYILDSLTEVHIFYPRAAKGAVPFPPPADSGVRAFVQATKEGRPLCPSVYNCSEGDASGLDFSARLWEDRHLNAPSSSDWAVSADLGYDAFMLALKEEVKGFMDSS